MPNRVKIIKRTDDHITIAGWGVVFGGKDLDGDTFQKDTNFMLDLVPVKPIFYDHTYGEVKHSLGTAVKVTEKDGESISGLWVEAQLNRNLAYVEEVEELIEAGALGYSSGSMFQLVRSVRGQIKKWGIIEFSLTPTPAEPRTLGVDRIKGMVSEYPDLKALLPKGDDESPGQSTVPASDQITPHTHEVKTMSKTIEEIQAALDAAEAKNTDLEAKMQAAEEGAKAAKAAEEFKAAVEAEVKAQIEKVPGFDNGGFEKAVNLNLKTKLGDSEVKAYCHYLRTGDGGGLQKATFEKASNDSDMNITTDADGGYAVPTGHFNGIIARRDEEMLAAKLGVRNIPGKGTVVNVPVDAEADGEFVATTEASGTDRDSPALGQVTMTLLMYTKRIELSWQLLNDEDSNLMVYLDDFVGRGMAKTHNALLLTEAATGTQLKEFASATAIVFGELEDMAGNDDLGPYLESDSGVAWVTKNSHYWDIKSIVGTDRQYAVNEDAAGGRTLLGMPLHISAKAPAMTAALKPIFLANWNYMGKREAPGFTMLRDPYSMANTGQVVLHYYFQTVYEILQAEAIGYGQMATA